MWLVRLLLIYAASWWGSTCKSPTYFSEAFLPLLNQSLKKKAWSLPIFLILFRRNVSQRRNLWLYEVVALLLLTSAQIAHRVVPQCRLYGHQYLRQLQKKRSIVTLNIILTTFIDQAEIDSWATIAESIEGNGDTESSFFLRARAIADGRQDQMPNVSQLMPESAWSKNTGCWPDWLWTPEGWLFDPNW
jgi:hypothetical protein